MASRRSRGRRSGDRRREAVEGTEIPFRRHATRLASDPDRAAKLRARGQFWRGVLRDADASMSEVVSRLTYYGVDITTRQLSLFFAGLLDPEEDQLPEIFIDALATAMGNLDAAKEDAAQFGSIYEHGEGGD